MGRPAEALDLIYKDDSYRAFYNSKKSRRQVVYVGANDGMLHAFNAGFFDEDNHAFTLQSSAATEVQYALGQELWAYVPFEVLPHLQALPQYDYDPDYGHHICFVDLKPRVVDVKFANGTWHTVLVCGMRFGGGEVSVAGDVLKSAYFALDITDPEAPPTLLWSFSDTHGTAPTGTNKMGFTSSYPGVVTVYDKTNGDRKPYLLVGSGPTTLNPNYDPSATPAYPSKSDQYASLYAIDIETGAATLLTTLSDATEANSYFGDALAVVDPDLSSKTVAGKLNYASELAYIGISSDPDANPATPPKGKLFRLRTVDASGDPIYDPTSWVLDVLCDVERPVTAPPNVTIAALRGQTQAYRAYIDATDLTTVTNVPLVHFGTGEYMFNEDKEDDNRKQAFYGIIEPLAIAATSPKRYELAFGTVDKAWLMDVSSTEVFENGMIDMDGDGTIDSTNWPPSDPLNATTGFTSWPDDPPTFNTWLQHLMVSDLTDTNKDHFSIYHGFKFDLESNGERVIGQPGTLGGVTLFTSFLPSNTVCDTLGDSRLYAAHYLTGSAFFRPILGLDNSDTITVGMETYSESKRSTDLGVGMSATPSFHASLGKPTAYIQTSTGQVLEIEIDPVYKVLPPGVHLRSWRY